MKYFKRIKQGVDVRPLLDEIADQPDDPWQGNVGRQSKIKVQRKSQSIPLRGLVKSKIQGRKRRDVHESRFTTGCRKFPITVAFLQAFAAEQDAELCRAKLVKLAPGCRVYRHIDRGEYYVPRDRYHLVLQTGPHGSCMTAGDEEIRMQAGELWWFDNKQPHEAYNDSDRDRIHFIFDLLPASARPGQCTDEPAMQVVA